MLLLSHEGGAVRRVLSMRVEGGVINACVVIES